MKTSLNKGRENMFTSVLLVVATLLLGVFFTSKLWMFDDEPVRQTEFNKVITALEQTEIKLIDWKFNQKENFMEVVIAKEHKGSDVIKPTFNYSVEEVKEEVKLDVEKVFESDEMVVLVFKDIPEGFRYIKLVMEEVRDKEVLKIEARESNYSGDDEVEYAIAEPTKYQFIGDYREITIDNKLETRDQTDYLKDSLLVEVKRLESEIKFVLEEKMPLKDKLVVGIEDEILSMEDELDYLTSDEREDTESEINSKKELIRSTLEEKEELAEEVVLLQEQVNNLKKKIEQVGLNGNEVDASNLENSKTKQK